MGVVDRVSRAIAAGETILSPIPVRHEAARHLEREAPWSKGASVDAVVDRVLGLGPIQRFVDESDVTDILVNGPDEVWIDRGDGLERSDARFASAADVVAAVERVIAPAGLRIDRLAPMVSARLGDGSRLQAVLPPAAVDHPLVAIRRFTQRVSSLDDLVSVGTATDAQARCLREAVEERKTIVVSGGNL